jgi:hydroxymethylpyrimidine pyrophosphatase-like HAD family hydrolase
VKPFIIVAHGVVAEQFKQLEDIGREYNEQQVSSYIAHEYTNPGGPSTFDYFFIDSRANKFEALRLVAEMSDVSLVNTMVTDDGINGAIIVENAGIGVAMGNATEQTKRVATFIAPNVGDNGAAIALEELVLHKFTG